MSKSILIIDTPNCCNECQFSYEDEDMYGILKHYCRLRGTRLMCDIDKEIDKICRLKPLPQKKDEHKEALESFDDNMSNELHFACEGWNACIDEMLKGEKEKAILVTDMPSRCADCRFKYNVTNYTTNSIEFVCRAMKDIISCEIDNEKDDKCPLKPIPQKKKTKNEIMYAEDVGYNKCLDEILGEKE